jgi:hypothetical protein
MQDTFAKWKAFLDQWLDMKDISRDERHKRIMISLGVAFGAWCFVAAITAPFRPSYAERQAAEAAQLAANRKAYEAWEAKNIHDHWHDGEGYNETAGEYLHRQAQQQRDAAEVYNRRPSW